MIVVKRDKKEERMEEQRMKNEQTRKKISEKNRTNRDGTWGGLTIALCDDSCDAYYIFICGYPHPMGAGMVYSVVWSPLNIR
jgi:hypothetical protein